MRLHEGQLLQGCICSASPSPPAAVASLRTYTQGSVATTAGPLGPCWVRILVSVRAPSEPLRRSGQVSGISGYY
ncbi:hypothetical protein NDU88_006796 [Pleurodeles waltl]|uniref:Uncharacterized protein n=1 Tax=Pleurodeles waltl TaxID=8319 RepID=A0AAV7N3F9_PLEWA|nr:hypothetical protein NDU88_006796 [Pleurodeles waltl]